MTLTLGTPIARPDGLIQRSFSQSAAGTADELVAAPAAGYKVQIIDLVLSMSVTGTALLVGLTGALDVVAGYPANLIGNKPINQAAATAVGLTTTTGAARGYVVYKIVRG